MRKGVNQFSFPDRVPLAECLRAAARLGYESLEICFTAAESGGGWDVAGSLGIDDYKNPLFNMGSTDADFAAVRAMAGDTGIRLGGVCSILPFTAYPLTSPDGAVRAKAEAVIRRMVAAAAAVGAETALVIPGGVTADVAYEDAYRWAQDALGRLAETAAAHRVVLAVENVWNHFLYSPLEMARFVDEIGSPWVGIYLDVANALILGYPEQWIRMYGKRLKKLHLKDFRLSVGNITGFTNILDGDVNWPAVVKALKEIGYDGDLVVELIPPARHQYLQTLKHAAEALDLIWQSA